MRTPEQLAALIAQFDNDMATKTKWYRFWLAIDQLVDTLPIAKARGFTGWEW